MDEILIYYGITAIALAVSLGAQLYISAVYAKYSKTPSGRSVTGAEAAEFFLRKNGLYGVKVTAVEGTLTDHYDPRTKTVRLSRRVYSDASVASVAVACHECGHALQHSKGYAPLRLRTALVPLTNFASRAGYFAILLGLVSGLYPFIYAGIIAEAVILLFQLVTLPVETDASRRALAGIKSCGLLSDERYPQGKTVLFAAALTYVAGVVTVLLQLFRLLLIFGTRRNRR